MCLAARLTQAAALRLLQEQTVIQQSRCQELEAKLAAAHTTQQQQQVL
jgi:hypothetical protein